jgi:hypothetical protein
MSKSYSFDEQLKFGKKWEQQAKTHLQELFTAVSVSNIDYDDKPELQRAGIDIIFQREEAAIDIKTQRHEHAHSDNLPIEIVSVMSEDEPGWFYDADSDLVVWVYPNKAETNLYKTGYLMPLTDGLREWFKLHADEFRFTTIPNQGQYGEYKTGVRLVPIERFPDNYLVEFDPRLPTDRDTPQSDIMQWAGDE